MKRTGTPTFVLTIPLVVKPGEGRGLIGCMEAGRRLYNATLDEALRRHGLLKQFKAGQHARTLSDKQACATEFHRLSKESGCTPAALITFARSTLSTWVSMDKRGGCVMNLRRLSLWAKITVAIPSERVVCP